MNINRPMHQGRRLDSKGFVVIVGSPENAVEQAHALAANNKIFDRYFSMMAPARPAQFGQRYRAKPTVSKDGCN
ncbi:hypothetical protein C0Z19_00440 [Trinickia soli]|uniref:Uncharacterized protein n=1 Tax=Trinickia soli TaxID=380675 RepID=A0A2N7WFK0_9BURK|nr:hypothetical protein C0Z19_00440 [Trinickia soli]